jgi:dolichol kinase
MVNVSKSVLKTILVRKSLHFLVSLSPALSLFSFPLTVIILSAGTVFYAFAENFRLAGGNATILSRITVLASHSRDRERFVLGPVTLGAGALFSLLCFPHEAFAIAMYALAFGDGFAGLVGRIVGRLRPRFLCGKSIEGSLACFTMIFTSTYLITCNGICALISASVGCVIEALPAEDFDNILIPLLVGSSAVLSHLS